tara:strand:+ start:3239 stop:4396 length:1158 start_codon:yes stop_codon:yes gene_type:complete
MNQVNKPTFIESSKDLLLKILKSSQLTKAQCGLYLGKHKHSLDSYLYKFSGTVFPASFAYFFLNSAASNRPLSDYILDSKKKSKKYARFEDLRKNRFGFYKMLEKYKNLDIDQKLIIPALEHHCTILIRLSNSRFIHDEKNYLEQYIDEVLPGVREYLEEYDTWQPDENDSVNTIVSRSVDEAIKATNSKILIDSIKNFFPHLEVLRKKYMPNFIAPNETFKLPVVNSNEQILFSKDFVKRNLNLNKYNDLVLMNVTEDNMQGTINVGDLALIIKFQNKKIKDVIFKNGIYAINLNGNICIRRLQFLNLKQRTLVHIISDNKKYRDDPIDFLELLPLIYGEVVWRSNNFQDIDFIKHENKEPNLFLSEEDIEIPMFSNNNKKETA